MTRLVVATTNKGKLREIAGILAGIPIELLTLDRFPAVAEPEETGETFAQNARRKALYYTSATGLPAVADDSGLEIDALDGAPGVHSARWHGTDYAYKFQKIRELLRERGLNGSSARFVCRVALAERGRTVEMYELHDGQRSLPRAADPARWTSASQIIVDGYDGKQPGE